MTRRPARKHPRANPAGEDAAPGTLPSRDAVRRFVRESGGRVGKREISRHFGLGPEHRAALRDLLRDLAAAGDIAPAGHKRFTPPGHLPDVTLLRITGTDPDGDPIARPLKWEGDGPPPLILMAREARGQPALAPGQRVLARLKPIGHGKYEGRTIKRLSDDPGRILGVFRAPDRVVPTDRRAKAEWHIPPGEAGGAEEGEIVLAEPLPGRGYGLKPARILERLGHMGDARSVSLICIHTHDIPTIFTPETLAEAKRARAVALGATLGPAVALHAVISCDTAPACGALAKDRDARLRGNSCYFPDRVVPMLPEELSNGWCSLRPNEDRGCLFVEMHIDAEGRKKSHRFGRGLMRSAARLTYEQVQAGFDAGEALGLDAGMVPTLYAAFRALLAARQRRGTLDLDLPERRVILDDCGKVASIDPRPRLDSHRLIEEFMVLANVAAAEELERLKKPCMYRVHAPPSDEKLANLRQFLGTFGISLAPGPQVTPRDLDGVLQKVAGTEHAQMVNEVMLRSQSQAAYSPDNIGHFGLSLARYAHFTSPIRRYADLLVHRALIAGLKLGLGALSEAEAAGFEDAAEHISATERRAALAEREAIDRYLAAYMADKIGAAFPARISGVTRFGLFVTVHGNGATGLIPISSLPDDYWVHDEASQSLTGRKTRQVFRLTQDVNVRLAEASPVTGGLIFALAAAGGVRPARGSRNPAR